MYAKDIMTTPVITVQPATPIRDIAKLLLERRISGAPVVDNQNRIVGIVSEADLMCCRQAQASDPWPGSWMDWFLSSPACSASDFIKTNGMYAGDVMSSPVISVAENTKIHQVISLLVKNRIKRLPVVRDRRPIGLISRADLLRELAAAGQAHTANKAIADDVIEQQLTKTLGRQSWAREPYTFFSVEDGVVHLLGLVSSDNQRKAFELAATQIYGVKKVVNRLKVILPYFYYAE